MICVGALALSGCAASRAWKTARAEDSAAAYHRFLRDFPDSEYSVSAQEHLDFVGLRQSPTLAAFREFEAKHPTSNLAGQLHEQLERVSFDAARAAGTARAYRQFATDFPSSGLASRARGNAIYLETIAPSPTADSLATFATENPDSDFANEARRSAEAARAQGRATPVRRVGLVVELRAGTPEAPRVTNAFRDAVKETFSVSSIELLTLASVQQAARAKADAVLVVRHREEAVSTTVSGSIIEKPGIQVTTDVELVVDGAQAWTRTFAMRVESREHVPGTSVLFGSSGPRYWNDFHVPIATRSSRDAVRPSIQMEAHTVAVDARGDRAVAVFEDGSFRIIQLADPEQPLTLARYARTTALEKFDGVAMLGDQIAIYGDDGLELVGFSGGDARPIARWTRGEIGSLSSLELIGDRLWLGGAKGLLVAPSDLRSAPRRVMRQAVVATARSGDLLLVADEDTLFLSTPTLLGEGKILGQLRVGRDFGTKRIGAYGHTVVVVGGGGVIAIDASNPRAPRVAARVLPGRVGAVSDVARIGSRIFIAGDRGLQVLAPSLDRVAEVLDVAPLERVVALGRHVVGVGEKHLQVVDGLPFVQASAVARAAD